MLIADRCQLNSKWFKHKCIIILIMSIYYPILLSRDTKENKYIVIIVMGSIIGSIICSLCICVLYERINAIRQRRIEEPILIPNNFTFV